MSRRSSRKVNTLPSYTEVDDLPVIESPGARGRRGRKIEASNQDDAASPPTKKPATKAKSRLPKDLTKTEVTSTLETIDVSPSGKRKIKTENDDQVDTIESIAAKSKKSPLKRKVKVEPQDVEIEVTEKVEIKASTKHERKIGKAHVSTEVKAEERPAGFDDDTKVKKGSKKRKVEVEEVEESVETEKKVKKKRKTKEEKEAEAMPLAARTAIQGLKRAMYIGAHVSAAGGVHNSITNATHIGGNAFALFLKSQRKWESPPLAAEARDNFHMFCKDHKYDAGKHVLPHGSYLVNLAQKEPDKAKQAYDCFMEDLHRCEALGIKLYNFHPGSTGGQPRPEAIGRIAAQLNTAHKETATVVTLLENMAGAGNVIGSTFEDLRDIIALVNNKSRVGVCIDTCHSFAAGYDLRTPEAFEKTMNKFTEVVGIEYLRALHLNDSKAPFSSNRDLHANIGTGFLGLGAFHNVMNYEPFQHLPMVLETPIDRKGDDGKVIEDKSIWANEIKLLEGLIGANPESEDFKIEAQRLQDLGASEREKFQAQVDKKVQKTLDTMFKQAKGKAKKKKAEESDASDEESEGGCSH